MTTATRERKTKSENKTVQFLNRYLIKATGSIVWHIRNGEDKEYCVTLNANGTTGCYNKLTGEECKGHKYAHRAGHECHHILACQQRESERTAPRPYTTDEIQSLADAVVAESGAFSISLDGKARPYGQEMESWPAIPEEYIRVDLDDDAKYEAWKQENRLNSTMSRDEYVQAFQPNEVC